MHINIDQLEIIDVDAPKGTVYKILTGECLAEYCDLAKLTLPKHARGVLVACEWVSKSCYDDNWYCVAGDELLELVTCIK